MAPFKRAANARGGRGVPDGDGQGVCEGDGHGVCVEVGDGDGGAANVPDKYVTFPAEGAGPIVRVSPATTIGTVPPL